jgi:hypothetical protein
MVKSVVQKYQDVGFSDGISLQQILVSSGGSGLTAAKALVQCGGVAGTDQVRFSMDINNPADSINGHILDGGSFFWFNFDEFVTPDNTTFATGLGSPTLIITFFPFGLS